MVMHEWLANFESSCGHYKARYFAYFAKIFDFSGESWIKLIMKSKLPLHPHHFHHPHPFIALKMCSFDQNLTF